MKTKKKAFGLVLAAVLLVCVSVLGTVAYLTSTDEVDNTFTVGNVAITLDEAKVDLNGNPLNDNGAIVEIKDAKRVEKNDYHLLPGHTYVKDPTVTVKNGSEESYVRMIVTLNKAFELKEVFGENFLPQNYVTGWDSSAWVCKSTKEDTTANTLIYEFWYKDKVSAPNEDVKLDALFDSITVPGTITNVQLAKLEGLNVKVVANAIQADGFADASAAWAAFK